MLKTLLATCLIIVCLRSNGQNIIIKGKVVDHLGQIMDGATIRLYKDSVAIRQGRVGAHGFSFNRISEGKYVIKTSFTGYADGRFPVTIQPKDSIVLLPDLVMVAGTDNSLLEVVVKATIPPVMMKKDTVVYSASAYKLRPNASIEELLKKLPGVQVDKDGSITMNGKKVEKIFLDGKEFPLNDPKLVTQGFNADMLAAVEAFDNQSRESELLGLKDMDGTTALNFKLKKKYHKTIAGKVYAATSSDISRNAIGLNVDRFSPDVWSGSSITSNTINGLYKGNEAPVSIIPPGNIRNSQARVNHTQEGFRFFYNGSDNRSDQFVQRNRSSFLQDSILKQSGTSNQFNRKQLHQFDLRLSFKLDSMNIIEIAPSLSYAKTDNLMSDSTSVISTGDSFVHSLSNAYATNVSHQNEFRTAGSINYRHKFQRPGQYLLFSVRGGVTKNKQEIDFSNHLTTSNSTNQILQQSSSDNPSGNFGISVSYTQPVQTGKVLDFNYSVDRNLRDMDKKSFNYNPSTGKYDLPDTTTSNAIHSSAVYQRAAIGYNFASQKLRYQLGIATQFGSLTNDVSRGSGQSFNQNIINWYPRAAIQFQPGKGESIELNYSGQSQAPSIQQLQPLPDISNPLIIRTGNPDLRPQFDHNVRVSFNRFNTKRSSGILASMNLHLSSQKLVASVQNLPGGVQEIHYENRNGSFDLTGNFSSTFSLNEAGRIKLGSALHYGKEPSFLNGNTINREQFGIRPDLAIDYSPIERLSFDIDGMLDISQLNYSTGQNGLSQLSQQYSIGARYELPGGWQLLTDIHYQQQISGAGLPVQDNRLWNAAITKSIFNDNSGQIRLSGYDLLGSSKGIGQLVSDQSIESTLTNIPQQLFLFSMMWNFRKTGM